MNNKKSHNPLLYIQQPDWEFPVSDMQQTYYIKETVIERVVPAKTQVKENKNESDQNNGITAVSTIEKELNNSQIQEKILDNNTEENQDIILNELIPKEEIQIQTSQVDSSIQVTESIDVQEIIAQYEKERQDELALSSISPRNKQSNALKRMKSFKEMNIEEKLDYLLHFPKLLPPVSCIFVTNDSSVRGFLMNQTEETIEVKTFDDKIEKIQIGTLIEIKMIGFN